MTMQGSAAGKTAGDPAVEETSAVVGHPIDDEAAEELPGATECLRLLAAARARLIPLSPLGKALYPYPLAVPTKTDMVVEHFENGGMVGCVPFSIDMVVVDINVGGEAAVREVTSALGTEPLAAVYAPYPYGRSPSLWFPSNRREWRRRWKMENGHGDIHGDFSCAIVWDPAAVWMGKRKLDRISEPHYVNVRKLFPTRAEVERRLKAGQDPGPPWNQGDPYSQGQVVG